ncbi:hypothetical protein PIROE2DRAFT_14087, partial [Piromyces sp. E2]
DFSVKYYLLKFLNLIFSTPSLDKFFYTNDIPVLLDVTLRELCNLTDENTHIQKSYLILLENLIQNTINNNIPYRFHDITKLLYTVSQRSKDSCYSNKTQHAKLVALSNLAQRILTTFSNVLDISTLTPSQSADNIDTLSKQPSATTSTKKSKDKKKKSKEGSTTSSSMDTSTSNKKEFKKGVNPLNKNKIEPTKDTKNEQEEESKDKEENESDQENEHERLSQRARDIFMRSYQQYQEDTASAASSTVATPVISSKENDTVVVSEQESPILPPEEEEVVVEEEEEEEKDRDHEKLSKKAMDIFMKSYQQYQENSASSTPVVESATNQTVSNPETAAVDEDKDHDKLSQRAMDIFMKSLRQYNDEQEVVHSATLPPSYTEQEENDPQPITTDPSSQNYQDDIYSANSYFPHDVSNPSQSYYTNVNIINRNTNSPRRHDNDNASISSNSTTSNTITYPTRYDSMGNRNIVDPIERHQSPFSDCYQIPSQTQIYKRPPVASPALSAASYQSNYSTSSVTTNTKPFFPTTKTNNIFKRENLHNTNSNPVKTNVISPLNYGGRKSSYSSTTSSISPRLNSGGNNTNRINPLNNIFMNESVVIEDPIKRNESPFDDSFSIE